MSPLCSFNHIRLRSVKGSDIQASDGLTLRDRLEGLMIKIADDIKACGNACDTYTKKNILGLCLSRTCRRFMADIPIVVKVLKGPVYELRLAEFATIFAENQKEIESALLIHTSLTLEAAMHTLSEVNQKVCSTDDKFSLLLLFRRLDSPQEAELIRYINSKGGPDRCMRDDGLLLELAAYRQMLQGAEAPASSEPAGVSSDGWQNSGYTSTPGQMGSTHESSPFIPVSVILVLNNIRIFTLSYYCLCLLHNIRHIHHSNQSRFRENAIQLSTRNRLLTFTDQAHRPRGQDASLHQFISTSRSSPMDQCRDKNHSLLVMRSILATKAVHIPLETKHPHLLRCHWAS